MREFRPSRFADHLARLKREVARGACFDLPAKSFWKPHADVNLATRFHGLPAATPAGPAAGPHTQMAQNILLSYLAGGRIFELKTVQIKDHLQIPRPCIDTRTVGFNIEWSQELRLEESVHEYVVAAWLISIARGENWIGADTPLTPETDPIIFDISVGYDLEGIRSPRVVEFLRTMTDATAMLDRLGREIARDFPEYQRHRPDPKIARSVTLSTFHGCPPEEIEGICAFLLDELGLHTVVKLNPAMLGRERIDDLLRGAMGYEHLHPSPTAFEAGLRFDESLDLARRLRARADTLGRGFDVKFSNTLETLNDEGPLVGTGEAVRYLSGQPLHVLTTVLMEEWRRAADWDRGMSFSAGIDRKNLLDLARAGCVPVTVCTDLLRPGGYARLADALRDGEKALLAEGKSSLREAIGSPDQAHTHLAAYAEALPRDTRYHHAKNCKPPRRTDSRLSFYDCTNCDKCIPVCPNDAMFVYTVETGTRPVHIVTCGADGEITMTAGEPLIVEEDHQLASFADWCNECGNCDTHCPEHGGPHLAKPRLFGDREGYLAAAPQDGFVCDAEDKQPAITGRFDGCEYTLELDRTAQRARLRDESLLVEIDLTTHAVVATRQIQSPPAPHTVSTAVYHHLRDILEGATREH